MPKQEVIRSVFIASPGDVGDERDLIESIVGGINVEHRGVSLMPVRWEHSTPNLNEADTQAVINESLSGCDVMVAVFGGRLGTATARAVGGAVEEVRDFDKPILMYIKEENKDRLLDELGQYIPNLDNRTWRTYSSLSDLEAQARTDIASWFNEQIKPLGTTEETQRPRLFIEDQFPVAEIGIESVRESAPIPGQFPKLKTLHVWWARRPLVASAAAVLGSLMPTWTAKLAVNFPHQPELATQEAYRRWFLRLCGIWGDPVAAQEMRNIARAKGTRLKHNPYSYRQAFKNSPSTEDLVLLHDVLKLTWGRIPTVLDPTAGGGSIPFEAVRYRLPTQANDLNSVAAAVLRAGVEIPALYGVDLVQDLKRWGELLANRIEDKIGDLFPSSSADEQVANFLFARTVSCPRTGRVVPLVGDWWLYRGKRRVAIKMITERADEKLSEPDFKLVEDSEIDFDPKESAVWQRGKAVSPWDDLPIDSEYIKLEAQAGRMGALLYAVRSGVLNGRGYRYRTPTALDFDALEAAESKLRYVLPRWEATDVLPQEEVPVGNDRRPHQYGMLKWRDMFTLRQLLVHGYFVEEHRAMIVEVRDAYAGDRNRADAILALIGMMQGKAINYNSVLSSWDTSRNRTRPVFDRHDFAFKNTFAERTELYSWCLTDELPEIYEELALLLDPGYREAQSISRTSSLPAPQVNISQADAGHLSHLSDGSQTLVCMDPPYYDNVMYAELADFFYVWEKRTLGVLWPELFSDELTDKTREAVANIARAGGAGKRAKEAAETDYTMKMAAIFKECHRVLSDDGVLTVMFTHKRTDAWNALGIALLKADFTIETSWPVRTESEQSLHQARSNSASSTIFLVCRKRLTETTGALGRMTYLSEIEAEIRVSAREAYSRSSGHGLRGVDLLLSTYGPVLSVLSQHWPVYSAVAGARGGSRPLEPEEALDVARSEVTSLMKAGLVLRPEAALDAVTDFAVLAWELFKAREAPFDEVRRLALAVGALDTDDLVSDKIIVAKSGTASLCEPRQRLRRESDQGLSGVNRDRTIFPVTIDAVHTALYIVGEDGPGAAKRWLDERELTNNQRFLDCLQALVNAIPRSRSGGKWNVVEAGLLDRLVGTYFRSITMPPDPVEYEQQTTGVG